MSGFAFDVFLSYAHDDDDFADICAVGFEERGFRVWIDEEQL